jgi:serine phosphatase RsbU (regulator of sigma subunit)/pSer/pThr/pTyr-binding forkhead associated (FHA) protein
VLRLEPISGPPADPIAIERGQEAVIGRSKECTVVLDPETVSRRHARLYQQGGRWVVCDEASRHGTYINEVRLEPGRPSVLADGDLVRIGPYSYHVALGGSPRQLASTVVDPGGSWRRVEQVSPAELGLLAQQRFHLVVDCAAAIHGAPDERGLAQVVLDSALAGTGFQHAALLRPAGGSAGLEAIEVLGHRHGGGDTPPGDVTFSRSLLAAAAQGAVVRLIEPRDVPTSHSIAELGITSALCAPILLGPSVAAFLYLDARSQAAPIRHDAVGFCQLIARLCGLALANLKRLDLERRHRDLHVEIAAAREAQQVLLPRDEGAVGPMRYAMRMHPGRFVAGDLFDVVELDRRRCGVFIGDVVGAGVGAGVIMAATQAHLHGELERNGDPLAAVESTGRYLARRLPEGKFVSLWAGVIDGEEGSVRFVDAGHGHCMLRRRGAAPVRLHPQQRGFPLGIEPDARYTLTAVELAPGDRLILYSDGLPEQHGAEGARFGAERIVEALGDGQAGDPSADVRGVLAAVQRFAGRDDLDDDTTVASVEMTGG